MTNIPQRPIGSLSLALAAEEAATRLLEQDDVQIVRSLRAEQRLKGLAVMMRASVETHEREAQTRREEMAAERAAARIRQLASG